MTISTQSAAPADLARFNSRVDAAAAIGDRSAGGAATPSRGTDPVLSRAMPQSPRTDRLGSSGPDAQPMAWAGVEGESEAGLESNARASADHDAAQDTDTLAAGSNEASGDDEVSSSTAAQSQSASLGHAGGFDVIEFDPSGALHDPSLQRAVRMEYAQASPAATASDAGAGGGVLGIPPYQLAAGGLALGLAVGGAAGGGGGGGNPEYFVWGAGSLNISTPGGTTVTVDASGGGSGRSLILSGASAVNVNGFSGSNLINATSLTGALSVNVIDDGAATRLTLITGNGTTTVTSADARDELLIDATALPGSGSLVIAGQAAQTKVTALAGTLNASALGSGELAVSTAALSAGQQRSLTIRTGAGPATIDGRQGDTIIIDAEALADNVKLKTAGAANLEIINLMGDLENTATGNVTATLDHDPVPGVSLQTTVNSTTAITVKNGTLDSNDLIRLEGAGPFTVTGLVADLDASRAAGTTSIALANAGANGVNIIAGTGPTSITGGAASGSASIDAAKIPDGMSLQLLGSGTFTVSDMTGAVAADRALGAVSVATPDAGSQSIAVKLGVGGGQVRATSSGDLIDVDALLMGLGASLTVQGSGISGQSTGTVTVNGLSSTLDNRGTGKTVVTLAEASATPATTVTVKSDSAIDVRNGSLNADDTIKLTGAGIFRLENVAANVDGTGVIGTQVTGTALVSVSLASDAKLTLALSAGDRDIVELNGRASTATMIDVETLDVRTGGNIAGASITAANTAADPGRIAGTKIDFADQTAKLVVNPAQHNDIVAGALVEPSRADAGTQTLALSTGGSFASTVPYIDIYELAPLDTGIKVTIKGVEQTVANNIFQRSDVSNPDAPFALTIKGSSGSDVIRSAAIDVMRGGLTIDLTGDSSTDYLYFRNIEIGNEGAQSGTTNSGLGGRVYAYSQPFNVYSNYDTRGQTIDAWKNLYGSGQTINANVSAGIRAAEVNGFDISKDKVIYLETVTESVGLTEFTALDRLPSGTPFALPAKSVIEIESGFLPAVGMTAAAVGSDPRALDKIAVLLDAIPEFADGGGAAFYVVVYDYQQTTNADAWLYSAVATQGDGFDFADGKPAGDPRDTDTLELIAIFKGVGVNAFTSSNFNIV